MKYCHTAFLILLCSGVLSLFSGCGGENEISTMENVLQYDTRIYKKITARIKEFVDGEKTDQDKRDLIADWRDYLRDCKSCSSLKNTPEDFRIAYAEHIEAWENFVSHLALDYRDYARQGSPGETALATGTLAAMGGENAGQAVGLFILGALLGAAAENLDNDERLRRAKQIWDRRYDELNERVKTTWQHVEKIAISRGASLAR